MGVPVGAIVESRNALAEECIRTREALDSPSLITRLHRKRIEKKLMGKEQYVKELDAWLAEVKK